MAFLSKILAHVNIIAIIVSGVVYWLLGSLWFGVIFGKLWRAELQKHGINMSKPDEHSMAGKFIGTFIMETIVAFGCAVLVWFMGIETISQAIKLGLGVGICMAALPMTIAYSWESRPMKLNLIDIGYPVIGITVCMIILTLWK